jgi:high frequency lysogenization protein
MSREYSDADHALALAGVFQAARMTFELARFGHTDEAMLEAGITTLFVTHPESVMEVYGGAANLALGLRHFIFQLSSPQDRNPEVTRYSIRLLQLGQQLHKDPGRLQTLGEALDNFKSRAEAFQFEQATRYSQLAKIYQDHISDLKPRILVQGEPQHLQNSDIAARIRCALLTGVRSAHLWYQCGGRRWHLLTRHKRLLTAAREWTASIP